MDNSRKQAIQNAITAKKAQKPTKKSAMEEIREMEDRERRLKRAYLKEAESAYFNGIKGEPSVKTEPDEKKVKQEPLEPKPEVKWIHKGIIVKILNKKLGEKFYKQKGFVESTDGFVAVVQVLQNRKRAKIDQGDLETVIPSAGREIVILVGGHRGKVGKLVGIESDKFEATIELDGKRISLPYEHVSKLHHKT